MSVLSRKADGVAAVHIRPLKHSVVAKNERQAGPFRVRTGLDLAFAQLGGVASVFGT